jgi:hypothetical protein
LKGPGDSSLIRVRENKGEKYIRSEKYARTLLNKYEQEIKRRFEVDRI